MNERDLREALINQGASGASFSGEIAARVIGRDRRIVRTLAVGTILLWTIAAAGILTFNFGFITYVLPTMQAWASGNEWAENRFPLLMVRFMYMYTSPVLIASACALFLAAIGTVALILFSRHASLRQINQSLAIISDQLREMRMESRP